MKRTFTQSLRAGVLVIWLCVLGFATTGIGGVVYDNDNGRTGGIFNPGVEFGDEIVLTSVIPTSKSPLSITGAYVLVAPNGYSGGANVTLRIRKLDGPSAPTDPLKRPGPGTLLGSGSASVPVLSRTTRVFVNLSATLESPDIVVTAQFSGLTSTAALGVMIADGASGGRSSAAELWVNAAGAWKVQTLAPSPSNLGFILVGSEGQNVLRVGGGTATSPQTSRSYQGKSGVTFPARGSLVSFSGTRTLTVRVEDPSGDKLTVGGVSADANGVLTLKGGSEADVRNILESLEYENTSNNPRLGAHVITFSTGDLASSLTINVSGVNNYSPVVALDTKNGAQTTYERNQFVLGEDSIVVPFTFFDAEGTGLLNVTALSDNPAVISNSDLEVKTVVDAQGNGTGELTIKQANVPTSTIYPDGLRLAIIATDKGNKKGSVVINVKVKAVFVNKPPSFVIPGNNAAKVWSMDEDGVLELPFTISDDVAEGVTITKLSSNPSLISVDSVVARLRLFAGASGTYFEIKPQPEQSGTASLTLTVRDKDGATTNQVLNIKVNAVPDAPVLTFKATAFTGVEFQPATDNEVVSAGLIVNVPFEVGDVDADDTVTLSVELDDVAKRLLSDVKIIPAPKMLLLSPRAFQSGGPGKITLVATDKSGLSARKEFTLTIPDINNPPAFADIESVAGQNAVRFRVIDELPITAANLSAISDRLDLVPNDFVFSKDGDFWVISYKPLRAKEGGTATITLTVKDAANARSSGKIFVAVAKLTAPPVLALEASATAEAGAMFETVFGVDDASTPARNLNVSAQVVSGESIVASINVDKILDVAGKQRALSIALAPGRSGDVQVRIQVSDEDGESTSAILKLRVNAAPTLVLPKEGFVLAGETFVLEFEVGDDITPVAALVMAVKTSGLAPSTALPPLVPVLGSAGKKFRQSITVAKVLGVMTVEVSVKDGDGGEVLGSFLLNVVEDQKAPPVIAALPVQVLLEDFGQHRLDLEITDPDTAISSLKVDVALPLPPFIENAAIVSSVRGDGKVLLLTSKKDQFGEGVLTVTVTDGTSVVTRAVTVRVASVNDLPFITGVTGLPAAVAGARELVMQQTPTKTTPSAKLTFSVTDADIGDLVTLSFRSSNALLLPGSSFVLESDGRTLTLSPVAAQTGTSQVTVIAEDKFGGKASETFVVRVEPSENAPPKITGLRDRVMLEDGKIQIEFALEDSESAARELVLAGVSDNQALVPSGDVQAALLSSGTTSQRSLVLAPAANEFGVATVTLTVSDPQGLKSSSSFKLTVAAVNDAPTISKIADQAINENGSRDSIAFSVADIEDDKPVQRALAVAVKTSNPSLLPVAAKPGDPGIELSGTGGARALKLTPVKGQFGNATVIVVVTDSGGLEASSRFEVRVNASANTPPIISSLSRGIVDEDKVFGPVAFTVGDRESLGDLTLETDSSNKELVPLDGIEMTVELADAARKRLTVRPALNKNGSTTITIRVKDPQGLSAQTQFELVVNPVNDAPVIARIQDLNLNEDESVAAVPVILSDVDSPLSSIKLEASTSDAEILPLRNLVLTGSEGDRKLGFVLASGKSGVVRVTLTARDSSGAVGTTAFVVSVKANVNLPPTITDLAASITIDEDKSSGQIPFKLEDPEKGADPNLVVVTQTSSNTRLIRNLSLMIGGSGQNRFLQFTPAKDESGESTITLKATDPRGASVTKTLLAIVRPVNDPPDIRGIEDVVTEQNRAVVGIDLAVSDVDNPVAQLLVSAVSSSDETLLPRAGIQISMGSDGQGKLGLTPSAGRFGVSTVTLKVADNAAPPGETTTSFTLTVKPLSNTPPTLDPIADLVFDEDPASPVEAAIKAVDLETPASALGFEVVSNNEDLLPRAGLSISADRTKVLIRPALNASGVATARLTVTDSSGEKVSREFKITVNPVNDAPVFSAAQNTIVMDENTSRIFSFRVFDPDTTTAKLALAAVSSDPLLFSSDGLRVLGGGGDLATRYIVVQPELNKSGTAKLTLTATDDGGKSAFLSLDVTVLRRNNFPAIEGLRDIEVEQGKTSDPITFTVTDVETGAVALSFEAGSGNAKLIPPGNIVVTRTGGSNWSVTVRPVADGLGVAPITLRFKDADGGATDGKFLVLVKASNNPPAITAPVGWKMDEDIATTLFTATTVGSSPLIGLSDDLTPIDNLVLNASSSNPGLFRSIEIRPVPGRSTARQLMLIPALNQFGEADLTITATDGGGLTGTAVIKVGVRSRNDLPTLGVIPPQAGPENNSIGPIPLTFDDVETAKALLLFSVTSDNKELFAPGNSGVEPGGLVLRPSSNRSGSATVTVTVTDRDGGQASQSFPVTVRKVNAAPVIRLLVGADQSMLEDGTSVVPIEIQDRDSDLALVKVSVASTSSNPLLFGVGSLVLSGSGGSRLLTIKPSPDQSGSAVLALTATDSEGATASVAFQVTVTPVNDLPEAGLIPPQSVIVGGGSVNVEFTATDRDSTLTPESFSFSQHPGLVFTSATGAGSNWSFKLLADASETSEISVRLTINDGQGGIVTRTFQVLTLINTPPSLSFGNEGPISVALDASATLQTVQQVILIGDKETPVQNLTVDIQSSHKDILPAPRIELSGTGSRRLLKLSPVTTGVLENATVEMTVTVTDQGALSDGSSQVTKTSVSKTFLVQFVSNQHPPTIVLEPLPGGGTDLVMEEDSISPARGLVLGDQDAADLPSLKISYSVSAASLIDSLIFSGEGPNRTVQVVPVKDAFGTGIVTLSVNDSSGLVGSSSFVVAVTPLNDPPIMDAILDPSEIPENSGVQSVAITGIAAGPANETELGTTVQAALDPQAGENAQLLENLAVSYEPNATNAKLSYRPAPNQSGVVTVAVTVTDGAPVKSSVTRRFKVRVRAVNSPPVVTFPNDGNRVALSVVEGMTSSARQFRIGDVDTPLADLKVSVRSLNPALFGTSDIAVGGAAGSALRTVSVKSSEGKTGKGQLELSVADAETTILTLIDVVVTHRPTIALAEGLDSQGNLTVFLGTESGAVLFDVADVETPASKLVVSSIVEDPSLFQLSSARIDGGKLRVHIAPLTANLDGAITVTVTDADGGSDSHTFRVFVKPRILPLTATIKGGSGRIAGTKTRVVFESQATGTGAIRYQWMKGTGLIIGATGPNYVIESAVSDDAGRYTLLLLDDLSSASASVQLTVLAPPVILQHPSPTTTVAEGGAFVLEVRTDGEDYEYQWRRESVPLPGQSRSALIRENVTSEDSGTYDVVVRRRDSNDSVRSEPAKVNVLGDSLAMSDAIESAPELGLKRPIVINNRLSLSGTVTAINTRATRQIGEPHIAGKISGKSVWAKWTAPKSGTMKLNTTGSDFDTLLGVYRALTSPPSAGQLDLVTSDDDGGGSFSSRVEFNAVEGRDYYIVVDGRLGQEGIIKLNARFQETFILSPDIVYDVVDVSAFEGDEVVFGVVAENVLFYQWYFNGVLQVGETGPEYRIESATSGHVGEYEVVVSNGRAENDKSSKAKLVLTTNPGEAPVDKPGDTALLANTPASQALASRQRLFRPVSAAAASGFRGTQVYNTFGSTTELGEPELCGILGGASQWSSYVAPSDGLLRVSTEGSNFDTLLGVFTGPADQGFEALVLVGCDNNSGADGRTSVVTVPVKAGQSYYFAVDGPNGQTGIVNLNYALSLPDVAVTLPPPAPESGLIQLTVPGVLGAKYVLQSSVNLISWRTVLETNAVTNPLQFRDPESGTSPLRFYRLIKP